MLQGFWRDDHADPGGEIQRSGRERPRDAEAAAVAPVAGGARKR
jgi:hypothetical protein